MTVQTVIQVDVVRYLISQVSTSNQDLMRWLDALEIKTETE